jgi:hypothetical protein
VNDEHSTLDVDWVFAGVDDGSGWQGEYRQYYAQSDGFVMRLSFDSSKLLGDCAWPHRAVDTAGILAENSSARAMNPAWCDAMSLLLAELNNAWLLTTWRQHRQVSPATAMVDATDRIPVEMQRSIGAMDNWFRSDLLSVSPSRYHLGRPPWLVG